MNKLSFSSMKRSSVLVSNAEDFIPSKDEDGNVSPKRSGKIQGYVDKSSFTFRTKERLSSLSQNAQEKGRRPHHSDLNGGKIEALVADDDPINQVFCVGNFLRVIFTHICVNPAGFSSSSIPPWLHCHLRNGWRRGSSYHSIKRILARHCRARRPNAGEKRLRGSPARQLFDVASSWMLIWYRSFTPIRSPHSLLGQVCAELRREFPDGLPILMVSANIDEASIVKGLQVIRRPLLLIWQK
jgi:hypothetical protein